MNERSDLDRVLRHWFDDGPSTMPDRVVDLVADRIARQRQRPAWRLHRRPFEMNAPLKIVAALAAAIVIAIVGWNLLLPGRSTGIGGQADPPSPSPSPSVAPSLAPAPTAAWDSGGRCGQVGCGGPQTAGTYTSRSLHPPVTYTLTSDWVNLRDWPDFFMLYPDTPANRALAAADSYAPYILILRPVSVSPSRGCAGDEPSDANEVDAAEFVEYLTAQDGLATSEPVAVTIGGLDGQQIDVGLTEGWTGCLPAAPIGERDTGSERYRFIVLDSPSGTLMIRLRAPADFETFLADAMPIVESFEFALGPASPSPS